MLSYLVASHMFFALFNWTLAVEENQGVHVLFMLLCLDHSIQRPGWWVTLHIVTMRLVLALLCGALHVDLVIRLVTCVKHLAHAVALRAYVVSILVVCHYAVSLLKAQNYITVLFMAITKSLIT